MEENEARQIGECERGLHLYFPGDLVFEINGEEVCETCLPASELQVCA
jgi:hypothetical protein